jgi:2-oxoglutarate dehydrogenase E1 component
MAISKLNEMSEGTSFRPVITEDNLQGAKKIIFCSGKVYYDLVEQRETKNAKQEVSIVRLEQLYPFPAAEVSKIISQGAEIVWCQEEPENMGAFSFVKPIFEKLGVKDLKYAGRPRSASPAVGFASLHQSELEKLLNNAI